MTLRSLQPPDDIRASGARVPAWAPRAALALIAVLLGLVDYGFTAVAIVGLVLGIVAALWPRSLLGWGLIVFLAAGTLAHQLGFGWRLFVLLAGVHLLHVLAMLTLELPARAWVAPRVFLGPLRRFVAVQVPVQVVAIIALVALAHSHGGHRPLTGAAVAVIGAIALAAAGLLLFGPQPDD